RNPQIFPGADGPLTTGWREVSAQEGASVRGKCGAPARYYDPKAPGFLKPAYDRVRESAHGKECLSDLEGNSARNVCITDRPDPDPAKAGYMSHFNEKFDTVFIDRRQLFYRCRAAGRRPLQSMGVVTWVG